MPRKGRESLGSRVEPDGQPGAGDLEGVAKPGVVVGERHRGDDAGRAGGKGEPDAVRGVHAARELKRHGDSRGDRADRLEVLRSTRPRAVEVDEVDEPG